MKSIFMRVLFCKIHCSSFICFCKPSTASHLYNSGPLKLENSPQAPHPSVVTVTDPSDQNHVEESVEQIKENEISEDEKQDSQIEIVVLRSLKQEMQIMKTIIMLAFARFFDVFFKISMFIGYEKIGYLGNSVSRP
ncbi:putative light-harvesting complex-like protein OHP2 [Helianthus annuus]|uniref:Light-harvesting complex-like protein OHP2 n=1 Tax=Helianthus annuus TaxID=4232 RepID=A0A9K3NEY9_HELAN|nr:putative light-harvesting complex-like protein OHP2 [Helianthus annuus]KAJ0903557.1 putative light-harvesting complex-like protein OHP2 [Helianthus annuus]